MWKLLVDTLWCMCVAIGLGLAPHQAALANTMSTTNGSLDRAILPIILGGLVSVTTVSLTGSVVRTLVILHQKSDEHLNIKREFFLNISLGLPAGWLYFLLARPMMNEVDAGYVAAQVFIAAMAAPMFLQAMVQKFISTHNQGDNKNEKL